MRSWSDNLERWVWYVFLFACAWQTRLILWHADRSFIEWRSVALYATDVAMLALFALAAWRLVRAPRQRLRADGIDLVLGAFLVAAMLSIRGTDQLTVSIYQWVRLVQYALFFWYVRYYAVGRFDADASAVAFVVGVLVQSGIAIGQSVLQHDLGLRWLGETLLRTDMRGVAVFYDAAYLKILRAYGTLPHPNVLAAYLIAALWALAWLYVRHGGNERSKNVERHLTFAISGAILLWALYATFSRTMIAVWLIASTALAGALWRRTASRWPNIAVLRERARDMVILAAAVSLLFGGLYWRQITARAHLFSGDEAVRLRVYYAREALSSGRWSPWDLNWTGVGIGNFTAWLRRADPGQPTWLYQPAHDLYLLVYSETGILGVGLYLAWLALIIRAARRSHPGQPALRAGMLTVLASFLFIALFDHFFWTLQQGRIIWSLALAIAASPLGGRLRLAATDGS